MKHDPVKRFLIGQFMKAAIGLFLIPIASLSQSPAALLCATMGALAILYKMYLDLQAFGGGTE